MRTAVPGGARIHRRRKIKKLECHICVMSLLSRHCVECWRHTHTHTHTHTHKQKVTLQTHTHTQRKKSTHDTSSFFLCLSASPFWGRHSGSSFSISHGRRRPPPLLRQLSHLPSLYPFLLIGLPRLLVPGKSISITFFPTYPASLLWT